MRLKTILTTVALVLFSLMAQAQSTNVFDKLDTRKDIQAVHVSKSLLGMISKMDMGGADIAHLADKLKQIDVYTSESAEAAKFMKAEANFFATNKAYESFMTIKEKTQTVVFYGQKEGDKFKDLVMLLEEANKYTIVRMVGEFTAKDIQQIVKK